MDSLPVHALDPQYDLAVVEQQFIARRAVVHQAGIVDAHDAFVALLRRVRIAQGEGIARFQGYGLVAEARYAYLGPLQVAHDGDVAAVFLSQRPQLAHAFAVIVRRAVRKIQACDIHARQYQLFNDFVAGACRPQRGDDLGAALGHAESLRSGAPSGAMVGMVDHDSPGAVDLFGQYDPDHGVGQS